MVGVGVESQEVDSSICADKHSGTSPLILAKNTDTRIKASLLIWQEAYLSEYIKHFRCGLEIEN